MYPLAPSAETGSESNKKSGFLQKVHAQPANSRLSVETFTFSPSLMKRASVVTLIKTGQRWSGQNRPTEVAGTRLFYSAASCGGKSIFVRQLRGPHLST
jgi:hypothetical protein